MKYIKLIGVFCLLMVMLPLVGQAQSTAMIDINATVLSSEGEPVAGAVIVNAASNSTVVAGEDGSFYLSAVEDSQIEVNAVGFLSKVVDASTDLTQIILLSSNEQVQLLFRKAERKDVPGGVSTLNVRELMDKNYLLDANEGLESHIAGFNGSGIWSYDGYLVLVDGIPRSTANIRPSEVESITVLKGAAAIALYGSQGAQGVVSITSKRGIVGEQKIDVRANTGMYVPKQYPNFLGSADYMKYYNEALINDGETPLYSQDVINATREGSNPVKYPDVDFFSSDFLKKAYNRSDITTEIYGGDSNARYYTNIGFAREGSLLNFGEGEKANGNRFNLKGNVDINLNSWLSAHVDAGAVLSSSRGVQADYWEQSGSFRPNRINPLIPIDMIDLTNDDNKNLIDASQHVIDGKYLLGGSSGDISNAFGDIYAGGHNTAVDRQFLFNTGLDMDLRGITPGLAFRSKIGLDYNTTYNQGYRHEYRVYEPTWDGDVITEITPQGMLDAKSINQYIEESWYQQMMFFSGQLDYKRTFNDKHNLFTMLVANNFQYSVSGEYFKTNNTNLGYFLSYNFLQKYYLEFNGNLMYSTKLPENNRTMFSPVVSLGWRLSDEGFMDGVEAIDDLKLTATAGKIYSDMGIEDHYMYAPQYSYDGSIVPWYYWASGIGGPVSNSFRGGNPELKAPYRKEFSVGLEASLFERKLQVEGNFFSITNGDGLVQAVELFPNYLMTGWPESSFIPYVNYNEEVRTGFDFGLKYKASTGSVDWLFGASGSYYDSEITKRSEIYKDEYRVREGRPINGLWGLQSDGFFASEEDIANSVSSAFGTVKPGDIKYIDQNGDNVIDQDDEVFLGTEGTYNVPFVLGVNLTAKWKNLTFYAQGVGRWGGYAMKNNLAHWNYGTRKYSDVVEGRWAHYTNESGDLVDTRSTATYPRLTTGNGQHNFRNSDFWMFSTDRFEISKVQITYSFPQHILGEGFFKGLDVYVGGANLLTISPEKDYLETNVGSAPQTRFFNLGLSASF